jgi:hypothetical protein
VRLVMSHEWVNTLLNNAEEGGLFSAPATSTMTWPSGRRESIPRGRLALLGGSRCASHPPLSPKMTMSQLIMTSFAPFVMSQKPPDTVGEPISILEGRHFCTRFSKLAMFKEAVIGVKVPALRGWPTVSLPL